MDPGLRVSRPLSPLYRKGLRVLDTSCGLSGQDPGAGLPGFGSCLFHLLPVLETLAKFPDPSVSQFPHLQNGSDHSDFQLELQGWI